MDKKTGTIPKPAYTPEQIVAVARRVTWVGFAVNAMLAALKILAGIIGRSSAMVADGVHSLSDFVTDVIVIVMIGVSRRKANNRYQYGHGKYETFATMLIAVALGAVAIGLFYEGTIKIIRTANGEVLPRPGMIALWMAIISIVCKEMLFHYTRIQGERIGSCAVVANAWHHRSDAISSLATLFGIAGAIFLGEHWRILDPIAAVIVSIFIFMVAVRIGTPSVRELLEVSLPQDITEKIYEIIRTTPGVITFHHFRSRRNGASIIVDFHIKVRPDITVMDAHEISTEIEHRMKREFTDSLITSIHIEPYLGQEIAPDGSCRD